MAIKKTVGESDGIYRTESIGPFTPDMSAEDAAVLYEIAKQETDLDGILADMESHARDILKADGLEFPAALFKNCAHKPVLETAARLIAEIGNLKRKLTDLVPDPLAIARQAIRVGQYYEQLWVRPFAPDVKRFRSNMQKLSDGHRANYGDPGEKATAVIETTRRLRELKPPLKMAEIERRICEATGVSPRQQRNYRKQFLQ